MAEEEKKPTLEETWKAEAKERRDRELEDDRRRAEQHAVNMKEHALHLLELERVETYRAETLELNKSHVRLAEESVSLMRSIAASLETIASRSSR